MATIGPGITIGNGIQFIPEVVVPAAAVPGSVRFNGSTQYLDITNNAALGLGTGDFTIEYWWRPTVSRRSDVIDLVGVGGGGANNATRLIFGTIGAGAVGIWVDSTPTGIVANLISGPTLASLLNGWHHMALTRQSGSIKMWVDGTQAGSTYSAAVLDYGISMKLRIMGDSNVAGDGSGNLSNIRIVRGTAIYTGTFVPSGPLTAISGTQLLLNTTNDVNFLKDNSTNNLTIINNGAVTSNTLNPF